MSDGAEMMMSSGDNVPSTIVCHFFEVEHLENEEDVMMDVLDYHEQESNRSTLNDSHHFIDDRSGATDARNDRVSDEDLCAMKDMVASMRRNPELLNQSPVMQRACLTSSSLHRLKEDKASPVEPTDVKNEDLCAMKDMIASMRKDPRLLYQSPVMQKACFTVTNTTTALGPSLISPNENTPTLNQENTLNTLTRRPLGTKFDPTRIPSLPLRSTARAVSIDNNAAKGPLPPATFSSLPCPSVAQCVSMDKKFERAPSSPASVVKMDKKVQLPIRPRSV